MERDWVSGPESVGVNHVHRKEVWGLGFVFAAHLFPGTKFPSNNRIPQTNVRRLIPHRTANQKTCSLNSDSTRDPKAIDSRCAVDKI